MIIARPASPSHDHAPFFGRLTFSMAPETGSAHSAWAIAWHTRLPEQPGPDTRSKDTRFQSTEPLSPNPDMLQALSVSEST